MVCPAWSSVKGDFSTIWPVADRSSSSLRLPRQGPQLLRVDFGLALGREQAVLLLLHVGELGVAEALDRAWLHEGVDELAERAHERLPVWHFQPSPTARALRAQAAELAHDDRLAAVGVPRVVDRMTRGSAVERGLDRPIAPHQLRRRVVV